MDELDIINFFPKYPNIQNVGNNMLNPYIENFNEVIYKKKEFYDEKLEKEEKVPTEGSGQLMKHQKIIAMFMSSNTPYSGLLLVHEMGTGKSCSAFAVTEQIRRETWKEPNLEELTEENRTIRDVLKDNRIKSTIFKGALVFARGEAIINNLINELVEKCTAGQYKPEYYTKREKNIRTKKILSAYYSFFTFEKFAKNLSKRTNEYITNTYSNRIIIIDEVHNLRIQPHKKKKEDIEQTHTSVNIYDQFWRFLHLVKGCKVLLLSGTPMKDQPEEIASIMNLLLPEKEQFPVKLKFEEKYLTEKIPNSLIMVVKDKKKDELKNIFRGYISYLRSMVSNISKVYDGKNIGKLNQFNVEEDYMSDFQSENYKLALQKDLEKDQNKVSKKGVYNYSRQAILFVFPDGSSGEKGYKKYLPSTKKDVTKKVVRRLLPEFAKTIKGTDTEKIEIVKKYSSKYAATIRNIIDSKGQCMFIYCEFVQGSGIILLTELLKLFGYSQAKGDGLNNPGKRFAVLSNITSNYNEISNIVSEFNKPRNVNGEYIQMVIGSRVAGEGISLKNILQINILTPFWNYSETAQAIARGIRVGSHKELIKSGDIDPVVHIHQRVSLPKEGVSIDLFMYELSEIKDISIKSMERLLKESAFDCALNYDRNISQDVNTRECDYMDCEYTCDGVSDEIREGLTTDSLDLSTYNLYYSNNVCKNIIKELENMFRINFIISLHDIKEKFEDNSLFEIITSLKTIINESYTINNRYGITSYLKEENNIYFLVDSLISNSNFLSEYYTRMPTVNDGDSFNNVLDNIVIKILPRLIKRLTTTKTEDKSRNILLQFPIESQETFIEGSIIAEDKNIEKNSRLRKMILNIMAPYITEIDNNIISSLLMESSNKLRCYNKENFEWNDCDDETTEKWVSSKMEKEKEIAENPYGFSGVINPNTKDFCIRDLSKEEDKEVDKKKKKKGKKDEEEKEDARKIKPGSRCDPSWKVHNLIKVISSLGIQTPDNPEIKIGAKTKKLDDMTTKEMFREILSIKSGKEIYPGKKPENFEESKRDEYIQVLYWRKQKKSGICETIKNSMEEKGIITSGPCGESGKMKKQK